MNDCLFCKIAGGDIPAAIVHRDEDVVAFEDINPQAPIHLLIVPRKHIDRPAAIGTDDEALVGRLFAVARALAEERGLADGGFRLVMDNGADAGQTVFHVHLHLLGGRTFSWPPG